MASQCRACLSWGSSHLVKEENSGLRTGFRKHDGTSRSKPIPLWAERQRIHLPKARLYYSERSQTAVCHRPGPDLATLMSGY